MRSLKQMVNVSHLCAVRAERTTRKVGMVMKKKVLCLHDLQGRVQQVGRALSHLSSPLMVNNRGHFSTSAWLPRLRHRRCPSRLPCSLHTCLGKTLRRHVRDEYIFCMFAVALPTTAPTLNYLRSTYLNFRPLRRFRAAGFQPPPHVTLAAIRHLPLLSLWLVSVRLAAPHANSLHISMVPDGRGAPHQRRLHNAMLFPTR